VPLDYFKLPVEPRQGLYLMAAYLVLASPFFCAGMIIALAYMGRPLESGRIYFVSMVGSATGAVMPALLLEYTGEGRLVVLLALVPLAGLALSGPGDRPPLSRRRVLSGLRLAALPLIAVGLWLVLAQNGRLVRVAPSPYKALSQLLMFPGSRLLSSASTLRGRVDVAESAQIRFAPGLSLRYRGAMPSQQAVYLDGDNQLVLYPPGPPEALRFALFSHAYAAYALFPRARRALLVPLNGGFSLACALAAGCETITVAVADPRRRDLIGRHYPRTIPVREARAYLSASHARFDLIHLEDWGSSLPGTAVLNQQHTFTREAFVAYLRHLSADGALTFSRRLRLPPADLLRLWATVYEALSLVGVARPEEHIIILRNWESYTAVVAPWTAPAPEAVRRFARERNFDLVFHAGMSREAANRFNRFAQPFHHDALARLSAAYTGRAAAAFFDDYPLDVAPQSDNRPFPNRFLKWHRLQAIYASTGSRLYTLLLSGEVIVAVVFVEALLVAVALLIVPLGVMGRKRKPPSLQTAGYFLAVGAGFMFAELFFIKALTPALGDPVVSLSVVLGGLLVFSGIGGIWSHKAPLRALRGSLAGLTLLLLLLGVTGGVPIDLLLRRDAFQGCLAALLLLLPPGMLMGLPFPLAMRLMAKRSAERAYGWSLNGCASVLAAVAAAQLAISVGIGTLALCGAASYAAALAVTLPSRWARPGKRAGRD
jgi:hypothetical protein